MGRFHKHNKSGLLIASQPSAWLLKQQAQALFISLRVFMTDFWRSVCVCWQSEYIKFRNDVQMMRKGQIEKK